MAKHHSIWVRGLELGLGFGLGLGLGLGLGSGYRVKDFGYSYTNKGVHTTTLSRL